MSQDIISHYMSLMVIMIENAMSLANWDHHIFSFHYVKSQITDVTGETELTCDQYLFTEYDIVPSQQTDLHPACQCSLFDLDSK